MISRRQFIRQGLGLGVLGTGLSACQSLERVFGPDRARYDDEIVIIGGGIAGLTAAYALKREGLPFRLFEAADRIGGRVRTIKPWGAEQFAELGAEYIDGRHTKVLRLCRELNLPVDQVEDPPGLERQLVFSQGRWMPQQALMRELGPVLEQLVRRRLQLVGDESQPFDLASSKLAREFDQQSAAQLFNEFGSGLSLRSRAYLDQICLSQFGVESERQSSLSFLLSLDPETRGAQTLRVRGGTGLLTRTLLDRVSGVLPDFLVRLRHRWVGVREEQGWFELRFRGEQGLQTIRARRLIVALPPGQLRRVDGWRALGWSDEARAAIEGWKLAPQTRTVLGFQERIWRERRSEGPASTGALLGGPVIHGGWDSSRGQEGTAGIFSVLTSGRVGEALGADAPEAILRELGTVWRRAPGAHDKRRLVMNWARHPGVEGAQSFFAPGEYSRWSGLFMREAYHDGRLLVAGEHASRWSGTLEGAVESGLRAAVYFKSKVARGSS